MRDAVGEEYKHFAMDLEFLLRRSPNWRQIAQGCSSRTGDIVEHGEAAEAAADDGDRDVDPAADPRRLARNRQPQGGTVSDEPSAARPRADQRRRLGS